MHKSPELYGAFPTDPYSHTPGGKGAQQPGMTGQVKEDVLSRFGELGIFVSEGNLSFKPSLLRKEEFFAEPVSFDYIDVFNNSKRIEMQKHSLGFTYCQVPIVYQISEKDSLEISFKDGSSKRFESLEIDASISKQIFMRTGEVTKIIAHINSSYLK